MFSGETMAPVLRIRRRAGFADGRELEASARLRTKLREHSQASHVSIVQGIVHDIDTTLAKPSSRRAGQAKDGTRAAPIAHRATFSAQAEPLLEGEDARAVCRLDEGHSDGVADGRYEVKSFAERRP